MTYSKNQTTRAASSRGHSYRMHRAGPLLDTLRALVTPRATRIYLAVGNRLNHGPLKRFSAEAEGGGWQLHVIGPEICDETRRDAADECDSSAHGRWLATTRGQHVLLELTPPPATGGISWDR